MVMTSEVLHHNTLSFSNVDSPILDALSHAAKIYQHHVISTNDYCSEIAETRVDVVSDDEDTDQMNSKYIIQVYLPDEWVQIAVQVVKNYSN